MIKLKPIKLTQDGSIWPDFKTMVHTNAWDEVWRVTRNIVRGLRNNIKDIHKYNREKYD